MVANDGRVGAGDLLALLKVALLKVELGRNLDGFGSEAVLKSVREEEAKSKIWGGSIR